MIKPRIFGRPRRRRACSGWLDLSWRQCSSAMTRRQRARPAAIYAGCRGLLDIRHRRNTKINRPAGACRGSQFSLASSAPMLAVASLSMTCGARGGAWLAARRGNRRAGAQLFYAGRRQSSRPRARNRATRRPVGIASQRRRPGVSSRGDTREIAGRRPRRRHGAAIGPVAGRDTSHSSSAQTDAKRPGHVFAGASPYRAGYR